MKRKLIRLLRVTVALVFGIIAYSIIFIVSLAMLSKSLFFIGLIMMINILAVDSIDYRIRKELYGISKEEEEA